MQEIARGGNAQSAAEAARRVAQSLGVVIRPGAGQPLTCRLCGSTPAASVTIHEHNGRIAWMVHKTYRGPYCRDCGIAMFRQHQNSTMFQGWFGFFSFFMTPVTLLLNVIAWDRLRSLAAPHRDASVTSSIPAPLNPGKPMLSRAGPYVAMMIAAVVSGYFLGPSLPALGQQTTGSTQPTASPSPTPTPTQSATASTTASPSMMASPTARATPSAGTGSSFSYSSALGDWIGGGQAQTLTPPAWRFGAGQSNLGSGAISISVTSGVNQWTIDMAAPQGQALHVGTYENAMRAAFRTGNQPGLDVSSPGRGCNIVFGRFTVSRLDTGSYGKVTAFEASFEQHCEAATAPGITGHVRFFLVPDNTAQPPSDSPPMGAYPATGNAFSFTSEQGDYIGHGQAQTLSPPTWSFAQGSGSGPGSVTVTMQSGTGFWDVTMAAPNGQTLHTGTYSDAVRAPFQQGDQPGISISGDGRGCNNDYGTFTVTKIVVGSGGTVTAFEATFVQHCEQPSAPILYGHIRYVAS